MAVKKKASKAGKKKAVKKPAARKPQAKKPAAKKPVAKKPAAKKPVAKKPAAKKHVAKKPAAKKPVAKKPAAKKPAAKKPQAKKPAAKKPQAKKPAAKKPAAGKTGSARRSAGPAVVVRTIDEETEAQKLAIAKKKARRMAKEVLEEFQEILQEKRVAIIDKARSTIDEGMKLDEAELPDEYDQATSEYLQYFTLRLRGREKYFLDKIDQALARINEGTFGYCETCGEEIGMNRLRARPETTLCIRCKEAQEREERQFGD